MTLSYALCVGLVRLGRAFSVARLRRALAFVSACIWSAAVSLALRSALFAALCRVAISLFHSAIIRHSTAGIHHAAQCNLFTAQFGSLALARHANVGEHRRAAHSDGQSVSDPRDLRATL